MKIKNPLKSVFLCEKGKSCVSVAYERGNFQKMIRKEKCSRKKQKVFNMKIRTQRLSKCCDEKAE